MGNSASARGEGMWTADYRSGLQDGSETTANKCIAIRRVAHTDAASLEF